jgi:protease IV
MQMGRQSIIFSTFKSLCTAFATIIGLLLGIVLVIYAITAFSTPDIFPKKSNLTIAPDASGNRELLMHAPVILKIDIKGVIGQGDLTEDKFVNLLLDSREGMLGPDRVKAILLCFDTPGGTVTDAYGIYRALMEYKKKYQIPVYGYVDGLCASGGMYVACAADRMFASFSSVIGSVGVIIGPAFNFSRLMDRYGVQALTITEGKDKDMLSPFRPWKPGEDKSLRDVTADMYERFVSLVVEARHMDREKLVNDYGAQIYSAEAAEQRGYIDTAGSDYSTALAELAKVAQLDKTYQVMQITAPHPFFADIAKEKLALLSGKVTHHFRLGPYADPELSGKFLYMYQPE